MNVESHSYCPITEAPGFNYGASGRGGWDENATDVVSNRKRRPKSSFAEDPGIYLARAEMQGRSAVEVMKMRPKDYRGNPSRGAVYMMANVVTRDFYIGCSYDLPQRWKSHVRQMRRRQHPLAKVNALIRQHGIRSFRFVALEDGHVEIESSRRQAAEKRWIETLKPTLNLPGPKGRRLGPRMSV